MAKKKRHTAKFKSVVALDAAKEAKTLVDSLGNGMSSLESSGSQKNSARVNGLINKPLRPRGLLFLNSLCL